MGLTDNLCMNCFEKLTSGSVCRNCGFDNDSVTDMLYLSRKTVLAKRYIVGNVIAEDGSCVTYIGYDAERNAAVSIHEFLPNKIANRLEGNYDVHVRERYKKSFAAYKQAFIKLWKTLKGLNSLSAVIPVLDIFEENETAYAVCEKMSTVSLRDFLIRNTDNNILWDKARLMFMPILTTLERLHENGIIHGAINPDNLVLCKDGKVRLTGFSISTSSDLSEELGFNPVSGYSALEQYHNNHKVCPATDIYAFSACIYRSLVGTNPPEAPAREINDKLMIPNSIAEKIPAHVI
ncbi:MAG: protein kinase, partial [Eubacterium sp.]|nr:protein kinase [Eubacterium sp.]